MTQWKYFNEAEYIDNGEWSDPELIYKGERFDYFTIEDTIYSCFKENAIDNDIEISEENFEIFCENHQDYIRMVFEVCSEVNREETI